MYFLIRQQLTSARKGDIRAWYWASSARPKIIAILKWQVTGDGTENPVLICDPYKSNPCG